MVAVVVGSLSYVTYSLDMLGNFSESLITEESRQSNKQMESFDITSVDVTGLNKLNTVIKNTGQIPLQITNLYIDEQDIDDVVRKITIDKTISPGSSFDLLAEGIDVDIDPTKGYNLKMSTSRGTAESFFVNSGSVEPLYMSLHVLPTTISQNFPVTLLFVVVNNMTTNNNLYNLTPVLEIDSSVGLATFLPAVPISTPPEYPVLKPGDIATFEYVLTIDGLEDQYIDVAVSLQNGYPLPGNPSHLQSLNATVTIKDVETAVESGSSIISQGIQTSESSLNNILFFHTADFGISSGWPSGTKQMSGAATFGGGTVEYTVDGPILHVSSNMTGTHALDAGNYNATLQYYSNVTSPDLPFPSAAFFFECEDCPGDDKTPDSIGNLDLIIGMDGNLEKKSYFKEKETKPVWSEFGGPDNDGYFSFAPDGKDTYSYLKAEWKEDKDDGLGSNTWTNIGAVPDTDAMWVRIPSTSLDYMPLLFIGEKDATKDYYEISIGDSATSDDDGRIVFRFDDEGTGADETKCITDSGGPSGDGRYDNGNWQHIVVVRTEQPASTHDKKCEIWVNGTDTGAQQIPPNSDSGGDFTLDNYKDAAIGTSAFGMDGDDIGDDYFIGDVALWMHWNDDELNAAQIEDLYLTNYGENATRINMTISLYDDTHTILRKTLVDVNNAILPFFDPSEDSSASINSGDPINALVSDALSDAKWKYHQYNVSGTDLTSSAPILGDRLFLELEIDDDEQNLPINLWISDSDLAGASFAEMNSFLQTPNVTPEWPTFSTITSGDPMTLLIFNDGPEGIWFTFPGTRFVVTSNDGSNSYGAMPFCDDSSSVSPCTDTPIKIVSTEYALNIDQDGPYVPDQTSAEITFNKLCDPVQRTPSESGPSECTDIPEGDYHGYIYLSGYDEEGGAFIRTIDLGNIHVDACSANC